MRSVCKKKYRPILRTDRPTSHLAHIWEISNGHISARGRRIHCMFGSTVGFAGSADRMVLTLGNRAMQRRSQGQSSMCSIWLRVGLFSQGCTVWP